MRALLKEGHRFSFFQAVRLLQHLSAAAAPVGHQGPVEKETVRFCPALDLGFAASDVKGITVEERPGAAPRYEIETTFLSLYGSVSPLPTYFTEDLLEQDGEGLQREFLDLFHHRAISLFYRVWEKYRYPVRFTPDGSDFFSRRFLALLGLDGLPKDHRVTAVRLLGFAGILTHVPRSAESLRNLLGDYFEGVPADVECFVPRWLPVPRDQRNRLARENCRLGRDLTLGERVYDRSCTFRAGLGPMGLDEFLSFLPDGSRMGELRELVDLMNGDGLDYEVELRLHEAEVPGIQLGAQTARLGWSTWLQSLVPGPWSLVGDAPPPPPGGQGGTMTKDQGPRTKDRADRQVRFLVKGWFHGRD